MISRLRLHDNGRVLYYDAWRNITSQELRSDGFVPLLEQDLEQHRLSLNDARDYIWVFDLKPEGIDAGDMQGMFDLLCQRRQVPVENFRVIFSCIEQIDRLPYRATSLPDRLIYNGNWYDHLRHYRIDWVGLPMTHRLTCLMRRPSIGRANLAKRLLSKFRSDELIMTFGTNGVEPSDDIKQLIWPQPYPMIVDRPMADQVFQHRIDHDFFYRAPVNLVVESSSQIDPNVWRSIFITEKTFKALAWHQFPVWYAVPGLVAQVRRMGFDVFDDVFDNHSYDATSDPWVRMTQVVQLVHRVSQQDMAALRHQHWNRLQANARLIDYIHATAIVRHTQILEEFSHA